MLTENENQNENLFLLGNAYFNHFCPLLAWRTLLVVAFGAPPVLPCPTEPLAWGSPDPAPHLELPDPP